MSVKITPSRCPGCGEEWGAVLEMDRCRTSLELTEDGTYFRDEAENSYDQTLELTPGGFAEVLCSGSRCRASWQLVQYGEYCPPKMPFGWKFVPEEKAIVSEVAGDRLELCGEGGVSVRVVPGRSGAIELPMKVVQAVEFYAYRHEGIRKIFASGAVQAALGLMKETFGSHDYEL